MLWYIRTRQRQQKLQKIRSEAEITRMIKEEGTSQNAEQENNGGIGTPRALR